MKTNKYIFIIVTLFGLTACNSGGSSGSGSDSSPVKGEVKTADFVAMNIPDSLEVSEDQVAEINLILSEADNNSDQVAYFEWKRRDGAAIPESSIRPVKGVVHLSPFEDKVTFSIRHQEGLTGSYQLIVGSENAQKIEKDIEIQAL